jgi:hypothetical protein
MTTYLTDLSKHKQQFIESVVASSKKTDNGASDTPFADLSWTDVPILKTPDGRNILTLSTPANSSVAWIKVVPGEFFDAYDARIVSHDILNELYES